MTLCKSQIYEPYPLSFSSHLQSSRLTVCLVSVLLLQKSEVCKGGGYAPLVRRAKD